MSKKNPKQKQKQNKKKTNNITVMPHKVRVTQKLYVKCYICSSSTLFPSPSLTQLSATKRENYSQYFKGF